MAEFDFPVPRTVEEADKMLKAYHGMTGRPLIVSNPVYEAMVARGISVEHVKRNDPLPLN